MAELVQTNMRRVLKLSTLLKQQMPLPQSTAFQALYADDQVKCHSERRGRPTGENVQEIAQLEKGKKTSGPFR